MVLLLFRFKGGAALKAKGGFRAASRAAFGGSFWGGIEGGIKGGNWGGVFGSSPENRMDPNFNSGLQGNRKSQTRTNAGNVCRVAGSTRPGSACRAIKGPLNQFPDAFSINHFFLGDQKPMDFLRSNAA